MAVSICKDYVNMVIGAICNSLIESIDLRNEHKVWGSISICYIIVDRHLLLVILLLEMSSFLLWFVLVTGFVALLLPPPLLLWGKRILGCTGSGSFAIHGTIVCSMIWYGTNHLLLLLWWQKIRVPTIHADVAFSKNYKKLRQNNHKSDVYGKRMGRWNNMVWYEPIHAAIVQMGAQFEYWI